MFNNVKLRFKLELLHSNSVDFRIKVLFLCRLYPYRKPQWAEVGQTYIHIRRNCTLWFWQCKNFANSQLLVKNKATGTPHEVYYIQPSLASDGSIVRCQECFLYIYTGVGAFGVARFDWQGNAKAFTLWNEWQDWLHVFMYIYQPFIKHANMVAVGKKEE